MDLTNGNLMECDNFSNFDLEDYATTKRTPAKPVTPTAIKTPAPPVTVKNVVKEATPLSQTKVPNIATKEPMQKENVVEAISEKMCECQESFDLMLKSHYKKMIVLCVISVVAVLGGTVILKRIKLI